MSRFAMRIVCVTVACANASDLPEAIGGHTASALAISESSGGNRKKGLGDYGSVCNGLNLVGASWYYDWTLSPRNKCSGTEFVPMIWGKTTHKGGPALPDDPDKVAAMIPKGSKYLLGFNEPDHPEQSHLSAQEAVALWKKIVGPVASKLKLTTVSPAVSCSGSGKKWLSSFLSQCNNCNVHHIACHLYECETGNWDSQLGQFKSFNKPIWITEMNCPPWQGSQYNPANEEKIMSHALPKFDSDGSIFRYAWFHASPKGYTDLWKGSGNSLTDLGQNYKSGGHAPSPSPSPSPSPRPSPSPPSPSPGPSPSPSKCGNCKACFNPAQNKCQDDGPHAPKTKSACQAKGHIWCGPGAFEEYV